MQPLVTIVGLLVIAAVTPGPNNIVVMDLAARRGVTAALPAIGGVVAGGTAALLLAHFGLGAVLATHPRVAGYATALGAAYLGWLGARLFLRAPRPDETSNSLIPHGSFGALAAFQLCNPKCWVLVIAVSSAAARGAVPLAFVLTAFVFASAACLSLWAALGREMSRLLARPRLARRFNQVLGLALVASAGAMLLE